MLVTRSRPGPRTRRRWVASAAILAASAAVSSCRGGIGCGETGLAPCHSAAGFETSIDVAVADLNGDGRPDVALPLAGGVGTPGHVGVFLHGSPAGKGYAPRVDYATGSDPYTIMAADLDGDGRPDVVTSSLHDNSVTVLLNSAAAPGTFTVAQTLSATNAGTVVAADLNGDGRPDLLIAADTLRLALQNTGTPGSFAAPVTLYKNSTGFAFGALAVGDLNGDGVPDVVAADNNGVQLLFVAPGAATPTVASAVPIYTNTRVGGSPAVAIADIDGDGRNDVVITDQDAAVVIVLLQSAAAPGQFLPARRFAVPSGTGTSAVVADLDGDGHPDIVTGGGTVAVLLQDGAHPGNFHAASSYPASSSYVVAVADVDGDGHPDIVTNSGVSSAVVNGVLRSPPGVLYQDPSRPGSFLAIQDLQ
jgi:hypothetical protein